MIDLVIVAGGRGDRMGGKYKQFMKLNGKPIIIHCIENFLHLDLNSIIVVVPKKKIETAEKITSNLRQNIKIVQGGRRRQDSVRNGIMKTEGDSVLIHDGVRPFVSNKIIRDVINGINKTGVCAPGLPVTDTLKLYRDKQILWTVERKNLLTIQTPQGFGRKELSAITVNLQEEEITDELTAAEKLNMQITWVTGSPFNIKITYPEDFELAKAINLYLKGGDK